jgi:hypothetical protein
MTFRFLFISVIAILIIVVIFLFGKKPNITIDLKKYLKENWFQVVVCWGVLNIILYLISDLINSDFYFDWFLTFKSILLQAVLAIAASMLTPQKGAPKPQHKFSKVNIILTGVALILYFLSWANPESKEYMNVKNLKTIGQSSDGIIGSIFSVFTERQKKCNQKNTKNCIIIVPREDWSEIVNLDQDSVRNFSIEIPKKTDGSDRLVNIKIKGIGLKSSQLRDLIIKRDSNININRKFEEEFNEDVRIQQMKFKNLEEDEEFVVIIKYN